MYKIIILFIVILSTSQLFSQESEWITFYEKSGFKETPRYDATINYCIRLAEASPFIKYQSIGVSPQGRDIPLLIIDKNKNFDAESVRSSGNAVLLFEAGIHPGEIDGKDAGLMFIRDITVRNRYPELLENLTILFIPIVNVDGHERFGPYNRINQNGPKEMGWRTTAQNINLNRDFLKADAPEMRALLTLFTTWLPDLFVDIHATDGADYQYATTYIIEQYSNLDQTLRDWTKKELIPVMETEMDGKGYPVFQYVGFRNWFDLESGIGVTAASPRYSNGYAAVQNRIGIVVENHMLKDYKTRVSATYELLIILSRLMNEKAEEIIAMNKAADDYASSEDFRSKPLPVSITYDDDSVMVDFKGFDYEVITSELTGGTWYHYNPEKPVTFKMKVFNKEKIEKAVDLPEAYIIPVEWQDIISRLNLHGIEYYVLERPVTVEVESYLFGEPRWRRSPFEGRFMVSADYEVFTDEVEYPEGSVLIDMNQRTARVIAHMFEPDAPDSFFSWGFFNAIFEQKEYAETYVMEKKAPEMIRDDPSLLEEFEEWKMDNPEAARVPWYQLNWFYSKSPWWDKKKNVYPIGRIMERDAIPGSNPRNF